MKKSNIANIVLFFMASSFFLFAACENYKKNDTNIEEIKIDDSVRLNKNSESPFCKISIDFEYINSNKDSVDSKINQKIIENLLGKEYTSMPVKLAVDSFKNAYIKMYHNEVGKLYAEDIKSNPDEKNVLGWYNYEYNLTNFISQGRGDILNVKATFFEYSGGAHPNEWGRWMNFDEKNGALLTYNDIFIDGSQKVISEMILNKLIEFISDKYKEAKVNNIQDLNNLGILNESDIYIPDNFLVGKDEISFLYNKYDIAPYSVGTIILSLPYSDIEKYMLK